MKYLDWDYTYLPDEAIEIDVDDFKLSASDFFCCDYDEIEECPLLNEKKGGFETDLSLL